MMKYYKIKKSDKKGWLLIDVVVYLSRPMQVFFDGRFVQFRAR